MSASSLSAGQDLPGEAPAAEAVEGRSPWRLAWERLRRDRVAMGSAVVICLIVAFALAAPLMETLTGHGRDEQYRDIGLTPEGIPVGPNSEFWLGTDSLGRDILVRMAHGARISLLVGVVTSSLAVALGLAIGVTAGYLGGAVDTILSRFMDIVLSIPFLLAAISLVAVVGASLRVVILVIAFFSFAVIGRVMRGQTLSLKEREFVEAARSLGAGKIRIMFVDIVPNLMAPVIVYWTLLIPLAIVFEATLSFLGMGVVLPTPTWGNMLQEALEFYRVAWWYLMFPGAALLATTLAFNLFGDGVRDALDPGTDRLIGATTDRGETEGS